MGAASSAPVAIHWFRNDLRLSDNPALAAAAAHGRVIPVAIEDPALVAAHPAGAAFAWWRGRALAALDRALGGTLRALRGDPAEALRALAARHGASLITWTRAYEPWTIARDTAVKAALAGARLQARSANGALLWEPWETLKPDGAPYRVFTPFYRRGCLGAAPPRRPLPAPHLDLVPRAPDEPGLAAPDEAPWQARLGRLWRIGEDAAHDALQGFVQERLAGYAKGRDFPALGRTSRLSPYLAHGQLSPNQVWHAVEAAGPPEDVAKFRAELGWREFSAHLLFHFPKLAHAPLRPEFAAMPWRDDPEGLEAWRRGRTGVPLVDAGMRELWQTGYMHNRVRMVVASFLTKNLLIDWRAGARWFADCLVDHSPASNLASWQWVAGSGADAAPYFRVFNPAAQAAKFDPQGDYIRRFVPELARLPDRWLGAPWSAPAEVLAQAGLRLGRDYPRPLVDLAASRQRALDAHRALGAKAAAEEREAQAQGEAP
ncbi:cryptochrome/photolyase family protein [Oceanicella actignis]|uniref:Deoxyribodipyrimidine photo-lyase n=1 Tax=Oceanicella actignis TaxID=1189325 RepID=A0A1M7TVH9_9RHOB|nr:deoxyribodipyrimidine photo-lyase [Oceanicella actignis]SES80275.1 deoxyribodipyrimidine photo-lyase [Oceanicella actignis]SHN74705.1 deoxyribodipyrimidine photo-lyase [Oceanicella actignis]